MSVKPKPDDRYAEEVTPFISAELFDDLTSDEPSPGAVAWARSQYERAMADPRPPLTSDEVWKNLLARHEARLKRDDA
jgi:hypothetical protein